MLVLTRKVGERLRIGEDIVVEILRMKGNQVRIGIDAPREVPIVRDELPPHESGEQRENPNA